MICSHSSAFVYGRFCCAENRRQENDTGLFS